jgi:hypothetical protein
MNENEKQELLDSAKQYAQRWLDGFSIDGSKYNADAVLNILSTRTFNGELVEAEVVGSPTEAIDALKRLTTRIENPEEVKKANQCLWDYYDMAFYESAYSVLPDKDALPCKEFFEQSLFEAFKNGLGFLINLGPYVLGVMRPIAYLDDNRALHRMGGPAIIWNEEKQWWYHGVQMEQRFVESPETVTPEEAWTHPNAEVRRSLCEIVGWDKVVEAAGAKVIHTDKFGELLEVTNNIAGEDIVLKFVRVTCPTTGRQYVMGTDHEVTTAHEGVANTFGMTPEEYNPVIET